MTYSIRMIGPNESVVGMLPDYESFNLTGVLSDLGSVDFNYARTGWNYGWLDNEREIAIYDDFGEIDNGRFVLEQTNYNVAAPDGSPYRKFTGRSILKSLEESRVYDEYWPTTAKRDLLRAFKEQTPGEILLTVFNKAKQFSEMNRVSPNWTFSATQDSKGQPWAAKYTISYSQGTDLLAVLRGMADDGMIEFYTRGRNLYVVNAGTAGTDRAVGANPLIFFNSRNTIEVPEKTDSTKIRTVAIVKGDENLWREVKTTDTTAFNKYGRRVTYLSIGGADAATMDRLAQAALNQDKDVKVERTYKYHLADWDKGLPAPRPYRDYGLGDWVMQEEAGGALTRVRVRQATIDVAGSEPNGTTTLTLNSMILESGLVLAKKVSNGSGGSSGGPVTGPAAPPKATRDTMPPGKVTGLIGSTELYNDPNTGFPFARAAIEWSALTTNADNSNMTDLAGYQVAYRYRGETIFGVAGVVDANNTKTKIDRLGQGTKIDVVVRAFDQSNNFGEYSGVLELDIAGDTTPPPVPSRLAGVVRLGNVQLTWDGKGVNPSNGTAVDMPNDFEFMEIYAGPNENFSLNEGTLVGELFAAGTYFYTGGTYGQTKYFRSRSKDLTGNYSALSEGMGVTPQPLVSADVADAAITRAKLAQRAVGTVNIDQGAITADSAILADAAVLTAKIADAAINNAKIADATIQSAKIANLEVGKITSGSLTADVLMSGNIMTAYSGQRVVINSTGIKQYASDGTLMVNIAPGGSTFRGTIRATTFYSYGIDTNGARYIEIGDSFQNEPGNDEIRFLNGSYRSSLRNPTSDPGRLRVSTITPLGSAVVDFDPIAGVASERFTFRGGTAAAGSSTHMRRTTGAYGGGGILLHDEANYYGPDMVLGTAENQHGWISNGQVGIKFLYSSPVLQVRTGDNSAFGDLRVRNLQVDGTASGGGIGGGGGNANYANQAGTALAAENYSQTLTVAGAEAPLNSILMKVGSGSFVRIQTHNGPASAGLYVNGPFGAAGSKNFMIPHPLEPDKWLSHAATESPTPGVEYWGEATVGKDGSVEVELPSYFEALTRPDHRAVFLTPQFGASQARASTVEGGSFTIFGDPRTEHFWMVKADRADVSFEVEPRADAPGMPSPDHLYKFDDDDQQQWERAQEETRRLDSVSA